MRMIKYNSSPLPFQGQKRRFIGKFRTILREADNFDFILDVFGGSGLLAHNAKQIKPLAEVVYNDFDDFRARLDKIELTNTVLMEIRRVQVKHGVKKNERVNSGVKAKILEVLRSYDLVEPLDYLTLSGAVLFSGNYANTLDEFAGLGFYGRAISERVLSAEGYLDGVTCTRLDYRDMLSSANPTNTLLLLDPPYLSTDASAYTNMEYWRLSDYLGLIEGLRGYKFIYFSSSKSEIFQLTEYLESAIECYKNPFKNCRFTYSNAALGGISAYTDIMVDNL